MAAEKMNFTNAMGEYSFEEKKEKDAAAPYPNGFFDDVPQEELNELVEKHLGFNLPRACGFQIAIKVHVRDEHDNFTKSGERSSIILPDSVRADDKYRNCTGLVVAIAKGAYKGERFEDTGPYCRVGDWVVFPRNVGSQVKYRGYTMQFIPDDKVLCIIDDPNHVTRD